MTIATPTGIQQLQLAYFGRPSDPAALTAWPASELSIEAIVLQLVRSAEYQRNTVDPNSTATAGGSRTFNDTNLINSFYLRLFGRLAAGSEVAGWSSAIARGEVNYDYLGLTILRAGLNLPTTGAAGEMRAVLVAKVQSNDLYSGILFNNPASAAAYSTAAAIQDGIAYSSVTTTSTPQTLVQAQAAVATMVTSSGAGGGQTFTLTTSTDTIRGLIGSAGTSNTAGNDIINGIIGATSTLNVFDSIDAGLGTNVVNINLVNTDNDALGFANIPTLRNVQVVNLLNANFNGGNNTFDADVAPNLTTFGIANVLTGGAFTLNDGQATLQTINLSDITVDDTDLIANYVATALTGTSDAATINIAGLNSATNDADNSTNISIEGGAAAAGFETVTVNVATASRLDDLDVEDDNDVSTISTLNIAGAGSLRIFTALNFLGTTGTINAANSAGGVTLTVGAENITFTGGAGNDRLNFAAAGNFNSSDVITFGTGVNTIGLADTAYTNALYALINGVTTAQRLASTVGTGTTINMSNLTLTTVVVNNNATNGAADNVIQNLAATDTVLIQAGTNGADVNLTASLGFNTANIVFDGSATQATVLDVLTLTNQATINITSNGNAANTNAVTTFTNSANAVITVTGASRTNLGTLGAAAVVNASAATGRLTVIGANGASSITGGSAIDTITGSTAAGGDTINGGAGDDNITLVARTGATADSITGGFGADVLNVTASVTGGLQNAVSYAVTAADSFATAGQSDTVIIANGANANGAVVVTAFTGLNATTVTAATAAAFVLGQTTVTANQYLWVNAAGAAGATNEDAVLYQDSNGNGIVDATDLAVAFDIDVAGGDTLAVAIVGGRAVVTADYVG